MKASDVMTPAVIAVRDQAMANLATSSPEIVEHWALWAIRLHENVNLLDVAEDKSKKILMKLAVIGATEILAMQARWESEEE